MICRLINWVIPLLTVISGNLNSLSLGFLVCDINHGNELIEML